ncbi:MAG TPA: MBL fold metallo-hydrolase [Chloroflexota bacterium]|nr:MBL fold metallo-hydrolase [Chloroflexota bacterium]
MTVVSATRHQRVDLEFLGYPGVIASFIFDSDDEIGLVETGPSTTLPVLLRALDNRKDGLERLTSVIVTHIHLDHAGAVGTLLRRAPNARVYVHPAGARHLVDPSRLLRSARRIYGNQMDQLWGDVVPVPEDRVVAVEDGQELKVGDTLLRAMYTPGHASHHIALHEPSSRAVYMGDLVGVRLEGSAYVRPATPPPDVDLDAWEQSLRSVEALQPETLELTHFGSVTSDIGGLITEFRRRLGAWMELVRLAVEEGQEPATIVDSLRREGDPELLSQGATAGLMQAYELATPYGMTVAGLLRYLEKNPSGHV